MQHNPLLKVTAAEWESRLAAITAPDLRDKARAIIWWDYGADMGMPRPERITRHPRADRLEPVLLSLGYAPEDAKKRAVWPDEHKWTKYAGRYPDYRMTRYHNSASKHICTTCNEVVATKGRLCAECWAAERRKGFGAEYGVAAEVI